MAESVENKRAGREKELRGKLKETLTRFEDVFGRVLSPSVLKEFLDESEKHNRISFLRDRMGMLSDMDVQYLRNILKENVLEDDSKYSKDAAKNNEVSLDEVDDIDFDDLNA